MLYEIAGLLVSCEGCGERFLAQAGPYAAGQTEREPDIIVAVDEAELASAMSQCTLCEDDCRYILSGMRFYFELLRLGGLMLHSSAVVAGGVAYLFSGPSGVGKSTHTGNWLKIIDGAYILNDDKPALRLIDGRFYACGTPWSGKHDISRNEIVPLGGICFLERDDTNWIESVSGTEAVALLLSQTTRNIRPERMNSLLELVDRLIADVPVYRLHCTAGISAAEVSYETMRRDNQ